MFVTYFYCGYCGYEDYDINVALAGSYANGDYYTCPSCGELSSDVDTEEDDAE